MILMKLPHQSFIKHSIRTYAQAVQLHKKNWKENVVYLYQFPRSPILPNLSPFCLKVETFLRANNLKYEVYGSWRTRSNEGKLPFIVFFPSILKNIFAQELNGKQIADSQVILWTLMNHFKIDDGLDAEQKARARAIERMIEGSTAILFFSSYENASNLVNSNVSGLPLPGFLIPFIAEQLRKTARKRLSAEGTLQHPREVTLEILKRDLMALKELLGEKKFFLGTRPTIADFTFFGHLGVAYHLPFEQPAKRILEDEDFTNLKLLIERIKLHYWQQDWPKEK